MPPVDRVLLTASREGDSDAVRAALAAGAGIETRDEHRRTPLLLAALGDHVAVAEVLVAAGADPDAQDDRDDSPWLVTGVTGSVRMMRALLPARPDPTLRNRFGGIALIPAAERGHVDYVRALLRGTGIDVDVDHVNHLGWTTAYVTGGFTRDGYWNGITVVGLETGRTHRLPAGRRPLGIAVL
ncbi:ankyrin repeat domain-containing protein [Streptomyces sp. Wb2n-11]|uniref:ankyrin repeat domain-containing protein n=1 Tax=Streptomyces sp. Wb2n-11 TaxID=1030533 RepID=UPI000B1AC664|nr:ankyrin repeat domain-containing protein [Streptomyces sp. Wb2n-11]